jgi:glycosyltransferase involved in cell wall biosynthesis
MKARPPRVAVIVPARNRADLLGEALESVLRQRYGDWEIVVVDDASTDDTSDVARAYAARCPERITVLTLAHNVGVGAARTIGINASRGGELICLLDHDDYLREDYLTRMVDAYDAAVAAGRHPGVISCDALVLTPDGIAPAPWSGGNGVLDHIDLDSMISNNRVHARAVFSRAAFDDVGGEFAPECRGSDDYDLWLRMLEVGYEAIAVPEPLVVYRDHPGSYSRDRVSRADGILAAYGRLLGRGALTRRQRRMVWHQILHYRASRSWELLYQAVMRGDRRTAVRLGLRAAPLAMVAFLQQPARWSDWTKLLLRQAHAVNGRRQGAVR